jgi:GT2 family glycosyltransferase
MVSKNSLMMVTFNRLELTKQTIENIYSVTKDFNFIIVDNGSSDGTIDYLKDLQKTKNNIHLFLYEKNTGIATGRNRGLKIAKDLNTEIFVTIDNDVLLPENWLEDCISVLNCGYGVTGVNFEKETFPLHNINGVMVQHKSQGNIGTACKAFNKKVFDRVGYFTTKYKGYAHEDANFSFRCRIAGFKIGYIKKNGIHLGEGDNDKGEYREYKNKQWEINMSLFNEDCRKISRGESSIYLPFSEDLNFSK